MPIGTHPAPVLPDIAPFPINMGKGPAQGRPRLGLRPNNIFPLAFQRLTLLDRQIVTLFEIQAGPR
jgi:hypothetical protein